MVYYVRERKIKHLEQKIIRKDAIIRNYKVHMRNIISKLTYLLEHPETRTYKNTKTKKIGGLDEY